MMPYPAYKPTGLPWLPQIPEHWEIKKLRTLLSVVSEKGHPDAPLLSVVRERGVIIRNTEDNSENHNYIPDELTNYKYVRKGQFDMNKMKAWQGSYGISNYNGIVSPAYFVFDLREVFRSFFNLAIRSKFYVPYFGQASDGIRVGQWDLSIPRMKEIPFAVPPPDEQAQIVRYLDSMTAKINKLIRAKKKQIALLQEQKQAIIIQAVTKGLNPNAEMKDSGIDWLGKIPKHWILNKVGHFYKSILGKMLENAPSSHHDSLEKYLCAKDVHFYGIDLTDLKKMWFSPEEKMKYQVSAGDLLVVEGGAGAGGAAVFDGDSENLYIQNSIYIVRPKNRNMSVLFLYFWLYALVGRKYIDFACNKATIPHFTSDKLFETPFVLVPSREQNEISHYLHEKSREYDSVIDKLNDEITLMDEYKKSMISSIVSGQADIRNIPVADFDPADLVSDAPDDPEEENAAEESEE